MKEDKTTKLVKKCLNRLHIKLRKKQENLLIQIFKFGIVGATAFFIDFILLYLFKEKFGLNILVANTLSFCISTIYNYIASEKWVFEVKKEANQKKQFVTFIIFSVIGLILNDIIMFLSTDVLNIYYLLAKIIATAIVMVFNFITRKLFLE